MCVFQIGSSSLHLSYVLINFSAMVKKKTGISRCRYSLFAAGLPPSIVLQFSKHLEINDYHLLELFQYYNMAPSQ